MLDYSFAAEATQNSGILAKPGMTRWVYAFLGLSVVLSLALVLPRNEAPTPEPEIVAESPPAISVGVAEDAPPTLAQKTSNQTASAPEVDPVEPAKPGKRLEHEIRSGDSLAKIFSDLDLSPALLHRIVNSSDQARQLSRIKPGQQLRVHLDANDEFEQLIYEMDPVRSLRVTARGDELETRLLSREVETRIARSSGIIADSLFRSAQVAGLTDSKTMELANLFGWDIDFALEIRAGDSFAVVYEEEYLDGEKFRDGPILAAEFINRGQTYRVVRYEDETGRTDYYTPEGKSVRKAFLRTPVKYARISSRFNRGRKHPILNRIRAHKGVDYAAPTGTPVRAAGDGKISFRGKKGGYGKTVILEHGGSISTLYAHLSRYVSSQRKGNRVKQGELIGYVGKSGLATGPHLHYEFRLNGVHRNPLTVKLPAAEPLKPEYLADFQRKSEPLLAELETLGRTLVADAQ